MLSLVATQAATFYDSGLGRFLISPGFAGTAALAAALVALVPTLRKHRLDEEATRESRWWDTFAWACDRTLGNEPEITDPDIALLLLAKLDEFARTDFEVGMVQLLMDHFDPDGES